VIAKVGTTPSCEAQVLEELSPAALHAGVRVPEILGEQQNDQVSSLLLSFIAGASVSDLLVSNPGIYSQVMTKTVDWLERWHRATAILRPLQPEQFEQFLFTPLNQLAPLLQNASNYRDRLIVCSETVSGTLAPRVAAHNDLTMANLLLDDHGQLGVVDWETACPDGLPFTDFYYAVTDAVRIAARCANWLDAFKACYLPEGSHYANVSAWHARLRSAAAPPPGYAEYCFHACWLHHASNEHKTSQPGEPRPFLEIVQWLALHESTFDQINN
jgi:aminoglycoside phosphotransferase (APT) family kinase protein